MLSSSKKSNIVQVGFPFKGGLKIIRMKFAFFAVYIVLLQLASCGNSTADISEIEGGWETDIAWITDSLPELHYNLFMYESEDSLLSRLNRLKLNLENLSDMETAMEITRILATMKCSHTGIAFWEFGDWLSYPISVMWLEDGLYVTGIDAEYSELISSELIEYGGLPALDAASAMAEMFPATNDIVRRTRTENLIMLAPCMEALGFGDSDSFVSFTFLETSGDTSIVQFNAVDQSSMNMVDFHFTEPVTLPLWLASDDFYWYRYLPEKRMLYCAYNSCAIMDGYDMNTYVDDLSELMDTEQVENIVVDLRRNSGGNSLCALPLIYWLREQSATGDIGLSLIIGRWTYSSGILNALEISEIHGITVYGENTGGSPNHLGEVRTTELPWSGIQIGYPTKYFQKVEGEGSTMMPDIQIPLAPAMLFDGENRILNTIYEDSRND